MQPIHVIIKPEPFDSHLEPSIVLCSSWRCKSTNVCVPSYVLSSSPYRKKSSREKAINGAPPAKIARPSSPIPPHPITPWVASGFSIAHRRSQLELPVDAAPKPLDVTHGSHNYLAGKLSGTSPPASALFPYASTLPLLHYIARVARLVRRYSVRRPHPQLLTNPPFAPLSSRTTQITYLPFLPINHLLKCNVCNRSVGRRADPN